MFHIHTITVSSLIFYSDKSIFMSVGASYKPNSMNSFRMHQRMMFHLVLLKVTFSFTLHSCNNRNKKVFSEWDCLIFIFFPSFWIKLSRNNNSFGHITRKSVNSHGKRIRFSVQVILAPKELFSMLHRTYINSTNFSSLNHNTTLRPTFIPQ